MTERRLAFMGTPDFAVAILDALIAAGHEIAAVYCQPPREAGRGHRVVKSPVQQRAEAAGLPVRHPVRLGPEEVTAFAALHLDAAVVAAYGLILPQAVLTAPRLGCFNVHASLLPRWRGAAPINRAVMAGDEESGVTIMQMDEGLDTGAMAMSDHITIGADMTAGDLYGALARLGADLMLRTLTVAERGTLVLTPQPEAGVTYAAKIAKDETRIDWYKPWRAVHDHIRGLSPFPGAWFELSGVRVKALRSTKGEGQIASNAAPGTVLDEHLTVACGGGAVRLTQVQRAGKQPMSADDFLRGTPLQVGAQLR